MNLKFYLEINHLYGHVFPIVGGIYYYVYLILYAVDPNLYGLVCPVYHGFVHVFFVPILWLFDAHVQIVDVGDHDHVPTVDVDDLFRIVAVGGHVPTADAGDIFSITGVVDHAPIVGDVLGDHHVGHSDHHNMNHHQEMRHNLQLKKQYSVRG